LASALYGEGSGFYTFEYIPGYPDFDSMSWFYGFTPGRWIFCVQEERDKIKQKGKRGVNVWNHRGFSCGCGGISGSNSGYAAGDKEYEPPAGGLIRRTV